MRAVRSRGRLIVQCACPCLGAYLFGAVSGSGSMFGCLDLALDFEKHIETSVYPKFIFDVFRKFNNPFTFIPLLLF